MDELVAAARDLADTLLFPAAGAVEAAGAVPVTHLDALAAAGLYGLALHPDPHVRAAVIEALAGGCMATAFVWIQHHGLVRALADPGAPEAARDRWFGPLVTGQLRAGALLGGIMPGPSRLVATPVGDRWRVDGTAPWVTGWGRVDLLYAATRTPDDEEVVWFVLDAVAGPELRAVRQQLVGADASLTHELHLDALVLPADRLVARHPHRPDTPEPPDRLRQNGSLALGLAARCARLLGGEGPFDEELERARKDLAVAGADGIADARAAVMDLAMRTAHALVVHEGSRSILAGHHAQRLAREALFLQVFGTRPLIRAALLERIVGVG